ncbi:hypothetical protein DSM106972_050090 [Dulcicalothrix desertica PCC 7102]|uniref:Uncharacterized protein n=1 Tax=Dulcicalothrix desertica PCC 7102 TaxID=232991 RepID=A0A3S1AKV8_9CYAN|nr:hypothetical protein DSM106972_050090 [Dulcicalothrix desertica PCC 7102]
MEKEIAQIEKEIKKLRLSSNINDSSQYRTYNIEWKNKLSKIDFKSSKKNINLSNFKCFSISY